MCHNLQSIIHPPPLHPLYTSRPSGCYPNCPAGGLSPPYGPQSTIVTITTISILHIFSLWSSVNCYFYLYSSSLLPLVLSPVRTIKVEATIATPVSYHRLLLLFERLKHSIISHSATPFICLSWE